MFLGLNMSSWLLVLQSLSLVAATVLILLQQRGASIGASFGGASEVYLTKRGIEKWVVNLTVVMIVLFVILRITALFV